MIYFFKTQVRYQIETFYITKSYLLETSGDNSSTKLKDA